MFLINFFGARLLFFAQMSGGGGYTIHKELTPLGWFVVIVFPLAFLLGVVFLIVKILKKPKLK